jgi:hypothetical protein
MRFSNLQFNKKLILGLTICILAISSVFIFYYFYVGQKIEEYPIVFGMNLGGDYDLQVKSAEKNGICANTNFKDDPCSYVVIDNAPFGAVIGYPALYYGYYHPNYLISLIDKPKSQKILTSVEVKMLDPYNYPRLLDTLVSAISSSQMESIKKIFIDKYGNDFKEENLNYTKIGLVHQYTWNNIDGVKISLLTRENDFTLWQSLNPILERFNNSYLVIAKYELNEDKQKIVSWEKPKSKL